MGGGSTYEGFPVPNPTTSYWQLPPHAIAHHRTTAELPSHTFDYVIVGSGISGAAVAYKLLSRDPSLSIIMLEARTAASGASGRNGGHCRAGFWLNFKKHAELYGEDEALKFERLEEQNVQDIADFVKEHQDNCDIRDVETSDVFITHEAFADAVSVKEYRDEVRRRRPDAQSLVRHRVLRDQEARDHMGIPTIVGAIVYPAHTQNPYLLVCKMLELSLEKGLNLQTDTIVTDVAPAKGSHGKARWKANTERGSVFASNVILCTNAYTNPLHKALASTKFLKPARSQVTAIRPGSNATGNLALRGSCGVDDMGSGDYFMCRSPGLQGEGDILYGGGRHVSETRERNITDDSQVNSKIAAYLKKAPSVLFGRKAWGEDGDRVRDWTGITCYTPDSLPLVGEAPGERGLWMSVGMNGHGMAMAFQCAEALVEMMVCGKEPVSFPKILRLQRAWQQ